MREYVISENIFGLDDYPLEIDKLVKEIISKHPQINPKTKVVDLGNNNNGYISIYNHQPLMLQSEVFERWLEKFSKTWPGFDSQSKLGQSAWKVYLKTQTIPAPVINERRIEVEILGVHSCKRGQITKLYIYYAYDPMSDTLYRKIQKL